MLQEFVDEGLALREAEREEARRKAVLAVFNREEGERKAQAEALRKLAAAKVKAEKALTGGDASEEASTGPSTPKKASSNQASSIHSSATKASAQKQANDSVRVENNLSKDADSEDEYDKWHRKYFADEKPETGADVEIEPAPSSPTYSPRTPTGSARSQPSP